MLSACLIIAAVLVLAVALRFVAGPDDPGNETVHHSDDEPEPGQDAPGDDVRVAA